MRYLVISDVHANLEALRAVLDEVPPESVDRVLVLGDIVGYGADPNAVVAEIQRLDPFLIIRGNHDKVACGVEDAEGFNQVAQEAALWTAHQLTPEHRAYLADLPPGPRVADGSLQVCHGSPVDEDQYIFEHFDALQALHYVQQPICFFGHTHVQIGYWLSKDSFDLVVPEPGGSTTVTLRSDCRYLVNPGAVGQPRDGDPRAAFATYDDDTRTVTLRRLPYDIAAAQAKILAAGLPEGLARRLALGR